MATEKLCAAAEGKSETLRPLNSGLGLQTCIHAHQVAVERECVTIQVVKSKLPCPPSGIADAVGTALDTTLPVFVEQCVRVFHEKPETNYAHLMFELKLHMELDRVAPKPDVIRWIGFVCKRELKAKLPGVELDGPFDVACAYDRVGLLEHEKIEMCEAG
jgi:hypothetical protein